MECSVITEVAYCVCQFQELSGNTIPTLYSISSASYLLGKWLECANCRNALQLKLVNTIYTTLYFSNFGQERIFFSMYNYVPSIHKYGTIAKYFFPNGRQQYYGKGTFVIAMNILLWTGYPSYMPVLSILCYTILKHAYLNSF